MLGTQLDQQPRHYTEPNTAGNWPEPTTNDENETRDKPPEGNNIERREGKDVGTFFVFSYKKARKPKDNKTIFPWFFGLGF